MPKPEVPRSSVNSHLALRRATPRILRSAAFVTLILAPGCRPTDVGPRKAVTLQEVASYGWRHLADSTRTLTTTEREAQGAVLASVAGIVEAADGAVFVLDQGHSKVVAFGPLGEFKGVLVGGYGQEAGEWTFPAALAVSSSGVVAVYDDGQSRLTLFELESSRKRDIVPDRRLTHIAFAGSILYGTSRARRSEGRVFRIDLTTGKTEAVLFLTEREHRALADGYHGGTLKPLDARNAVFAHPAIGKWTILDSDGIHESGGVDLFPWLKSITIDRPILGRSATMWPIAVRAGGRLPNGNMGVVYSIYHDLPLNRSFPVDPGSGTMLVEVSAEGHVVGFSQLANSVAAPYAMTFAPSDNTLVYASPYPYQRVVRVRVEPAFGRSRSSDVYGIRVATADH